MWLPTLQGTIPGSPNSYTLDDHHTFQAGKWYEVCGNTGEQRGAVGALEVRCMWQAWGCRGGSACGGGGSQELPGWGALSARPRCPARLAAAALLTGAASPSLPARLQPPWWATAGWGGTLR